MMVEPPEVNSDEKRSLNMKDSRKNIRVLAEVPEQDERSPLPT